MIDSKILLVEGMDDLRVLCAILKRNEFPEVFSVKSADGIGNLVKQIPVYVKASNLTSLGIVVDADFDIRARWQSLREILSGAGYKNVPDEPQAGGSVIFEDSLPRLGIWLMPDNKIPGMLEDFVKLLIDPNDELQAHAERVVNGLPACQGRFAEVHKAKAIIHTWLAWRENPGTPMGSAITFKYLTTENDHVQDFCAWLKRVYF